MIVNHAPIDYGTTPLPPAQEAALIEQCDRVTRLGRDGNVDEALQVADHVWDELPGTDLNQKVLAEVVPQMVSSNAMLAAARAGRRPDAERWLERFNASYGYEDDPTVLTERGEVYYLLGDMAKARQTFKTMLDTYDERAFRDKNPDYLKLANGADLRPTDEPSSSTEGKAPDAAAVEQIETLSEQGNDLMESEDWRGALKCWQQALDLVPEPRTAWPPSEWLYGSIADAYWTGRQYEEALEAAQLGLQSGEGRGNAFIWLRAGQAQFELGDRPAALESLTGAFMLGGHEIFEGEDSKYLAFLKDSGVRGV